MSTVKMNTANFKQIERCIIELGQGNNDAFDRLYTLLNRSVYAYALTIMRNVHDAQDITNDCFVSIYANAHKYLAQGKPMAWIMSIVKNMCYSRFRQSQRFADVDESQLENQLLASSDASAEDRIVVRTCLYKLSEQERIVVVLHAVAGMKHKDIAEHLQIPLSTVLSKYNRALAKLKLYLQEAQDEQT